MSSGKLQEVCPSCWEEYCRLSRPIPNGDLCTTELVDEEVACLRRIGVEGAIPKSIVVSDERVSGTSRNCFCAFSVVLMSMTVDVTNGWECETRPEDGGGTKEREEIERFILYNGESTGHLNYRSGP